MPSAKVQVHAIYVSWWIIKELSLVRSVQEHVSSYQSTGSLQGSHWLSRNTVIIMPCWLPLVSSVQGVGEVRQPAPDGICKIGKAVNCTEPWWMGLEEGCRVIFFGRGKSHFLQGSLRLRWTQSNINVIKDVVALCSRWGIPVTAGCRSSFSSLSRSRCHILLNKDAASRKVLVTWREKKARNVLKEKWQSPQS